jgi:hypothetical protein
MKSGLSGKCVMLSLEAPPPPLPPPTRSPTILGKEMVISVRNYQEIFHIYPLTPIQIALALPPEHWVVFMYLYKLCGEKALIET